MQEPKPRLSKNKKRLLALLAAVLLIAVAVVVTVSFSREPKETVQNAPAAKIVQIQITEQGFVPASVTIEKGSIVEWVSDDASTTHVVQANPYPTGEDLPGMESGQLGAGGNYRFKFTETGSFGYHDKLDPSVNGTIVVK